MPKLYWGMQLLLVTTLAFRVSVLYHESVVRKSAFDLLMRRITNIRGNKHRLTNSIIDWMEKLFVFSKAIGCHSWN